MHRATPHTDAAPDHSAPHGSGPHRRRILIAAGPTHEPIDAVRFIGNRSSGRLGVALAEHAQQQAMDVSLLLGPTPVQPTDTRIALHRFRTAADLQARLAEHMPHTDILVMAAAVADYRPRTDHTDLAGKHRRTGRRMTLELESTPDLLAECAARRRPDQLLVGFALEPEAELLGSARRKLETKGIDLVVANPLETMDSDRIAATIVSRPGLGLEPHLATDGPIPKSDFADWILDIIARAHQGLAAGSA